MRAVILGGTGTLGRELTCQLLARKTFDSIVIVSRDDHKHKEMAHEFQGAEGLHFRVGDIRDRARIADLLRHGDDVFHVAALKHVDSGEENPEEYIKTDLSGTIAVADSAIEKLCSHVVFSSSDKAVEPINVYGACKFISERVLLKKNHDQARTKFSVFRWGNVLGSNGSVLESFARDLVNSGSVQVTHPSMTRFWIAIQDAVAFMLDNYRTAPLGSALIPDLKAASVLDLAASVARLKGIGPYAVNTVGIRAGEKLHERLEPFPSPLHSGEYIQYTPEQLDSLVGPVIRGAL